jgi:hypothetical protein
MAVRRDILLVTVLLVAVAIAFQMRTSGFIATFLGPLLVLVLPGYAIFAAISRQSRVAASERLLFSLGLSFICAALGAIVLNLTPQGAVPFAWLALLSAVTATGLIVALLRRPSDESEPSAPLTVERLPALLFVGAFIVVVAAGVASRAGAEGDPSAPVTQLWMVPTASGHALEVGMMSSEGGRYRLEIWRGTTKYQEWSLITLAPGQLWRQLLPTPAGAGPVEARLLSPSPEGRRLRVVSVTPLS